jgi:hypothetical protein
MDVSQQETDDMSSCSSYRSPSPGAIQEYNDLMSSLLPPSLLEPSFFQPIDDAPAEALAESEEDDGKPMTKAEKQNAKKKRRKERERLDRLKVEQAMKPVLREEKQAEKLVGELIGR